jgi:hypothetical protein
VDWEGLIWSSVPKGLLSCGELVLFISGGRHGGFLGVYALFYTAGCKVVSFMGWDGIIAIDGSAA